MKKPGKMAMAKGSKERSQGKIGGSGINKPVKAEKVPQKKMSVKYGDPTQKQKL